MKKIIYIFSAFLLGLVSCTEMPFDAPEPVKPEETGLVSVIMQLQVPVPLEAFTKANMAENPEIDYIKVAVFGTSGYPQAYTLAEPVNADGTPRSSYATTNGVTNYFKVLLPVYEGEAHVHIIANGDENIKFQDEDEDSIMTQMRTQNGVGAYWTRVILMNGILPQKDENGIMQTDDEGNFIPSDETKELFEGLTLVRNFAEIKLSIDSVVDNLSDVSWTVVNKPTFGSVAPLSSGFVDDFKDYEYNADDGTMVNGSIVYDGFVFDDDPMDFDIPAAPADNVVSNDTWVLPTTPNFVYERTLPGSQKATCLLVRGKFKAEGHATDSYYTYYRIDLMDEAVGGYYPIYRNNVYQVKIHKVGNRGATTPTEAMNRDSGGNVSMSTEAQKLTDISDGVSRLYIEYVEKNFTSGGNKSVWVYYVPDVSTGVVDNTKISWSIKEQGTALVEGATVTKSSVSSDTGVYVLEFELNDQNEESDLVSKLQIKATNGVEGDDNSTLYRDVTLRVMKKMQMDLSLVPKQVADQGETTLLKIGLPDDLPSSIFPLEFYIEDSNHTLYSTGSDGNGHTITVPVKSDKSIVDGTTDSFYFIRTVNESEYLSDHTISTQFKTSKAASATTIYVANEFFKTQSINLLNDGIYINPASASVPFNTTSVTVEVEFAEPDGKTWTVAAGSGIDSITDAEGTAFTGATGNGSFVLNFPINNSTTANVTRTATITYNGTPHTVTITQNPLQFMVTPASQTISSAATTATVTLHAEEGKSWTASISGPAGTNPTLSATSGTGSATLTVTLPANTTANQRTFTVTATMTDPAGTSTATIVQRRGPASPATFGNLTVTNNAASASSSDGYISISYANVSRGGGSGYSYIRMSNGNSNGSFTLTPSEGIRIIGVTINFTTTGYTETSQNCVSTGSYTSSGTTGTWTLSTTSPATFTGSTNGNNGRRISSVVVTYEAI